MKGRNKKAAIELSIGTIIIIVLGVSMLILGMVLIRSIMCKAIGLTDDTGNRAKQELDKYFGSDSAQEAVCLGATATTANILAGDTQYIWCEIRPTEKAIYQVKIVSVESQIPSLSNDNLLKYFTKKENSATLSPGSTLPFKALVVNIPKTAPEGLIIVKVQIYKNNELLDTQDLSLKITRVGMVQKSVC